MIPADLCEFQVKMAENTISAYLWASVLFFTLLSKRIQFQEKHLLWCFSFLVCMLLCKYVTYNCDMNLTLLISTVFMF